MGHRLGNTRCGISSETCLQMSANDQTERLWPGTGEERFPDPTLNHYEMPASDPYTYPPSTGVTSPSPSPQNRRRTPTTPPSSPHQDCRKLERSNDRMAMIFWFLVVCCVIVFFVYVVTIVVVFVSLSRMSGGGDPSSTTPEGQSEGVSQQREELCVHEDEIRKFQGKWDSGDQRDIQSLVNDNSYVYRSSTQQYCFTTLDWVPRIMAKIHCKVQESVSDIEKKQQKINEIVSVYTGANNNGSICSVRETREKAKRNSTNPEDAVYAHFFIDTGAEYHEKPVTAAVRLTRAGQVLSSRVGLGMVNDSGFQIRHSGFYFVYSTLVFRTNDATVHRVVRRRGGVSSTLLESTQGPVSSLQGVFKLQANDTLTMEATVRVLNTGTNKMSYFGTYLIRT